MAKYNIDGKNRAVNLDDLTFEITDVNETSVTLNWKYTDASRGFGPNMEDLFKYDEELLDEGMPVFGLYLNYTVCKGQKAVVDYLSYEKGRSSVEVKISLTKKEIARFQELLDNNEELKTSFSKEISEQFIAEQVRNILSAALTKEYADSILDHYDEETERTVLEAIIENIIGTVWDSTGRYSVDDIRLAVGKELAAQLGE